MKIRKANIKDIVNIKNLIDFYAKKELMLAVSLNQLYENIRDFWVVEEEREIIGCVALHIIWKDLAEIKSLAIKENWQNRGIGRELVKVCLNEARELLIKKIFVLTYVEEFFKKFGFRKINKSKLPHKIWVECINCAKFPNCDEVALIKEVESNE